MSDLIPDPARTALFIGDFYADMMSTLPHATERNVISNTVNLQRAARDAGLLVCYSATVFRPGYVEISSRNKTFSQRKESGQPAVSDPTQLIHDAVKPIDGEVVVGKHRVNALYGTGLDVVLRANDIETLIILGYAADLDYRLVVVEDCCADQQPDVHDFLTQRIFPRQADVVSSGKVVDALDRS
jgi:nicotinamidase-related amidase